VKCGSIFGNRETAMQDSHIQDEPTVITKLTPVLFEPSTAPKLGTLTVLLGREVGASFAVSSQALLIGRNPRAHIPLQDDGAPRNHARVITRGRTFELEDLGSTNGTYVGGARIRGRTPLQDGDRIQIGNTLLRFSLKDELEWEASRTVYEASVRDGLTASFNRRYFEERLISEFAFAARHGTPLCVLLADIDHFKEVNDQHGHQAGDHVLRGVATALRGGLRTEDVLARYGGEEFAILARGIEAPGARVLAERLRILTERCQLAWDGQPIPVTVSIGLAHNHAGAAASDPQRLVAAADKALYAAKKAGRNRSESATSPGRYSVHSERPAAAAAAPTVAPIPPMRRPWDPPVQDRRASSEEPIVDFPPDYVSPRKPPRT
jgi:two-component system, cell cycle response regulator